MSEENKEWSIKRSMEKLHESGAVLLTVGFAAVIVWFAIEIGVYIPIGLMIAGAGFMAVSFIVKKMVP